MFGRKTFTSRDTKFPPTTRFSALPSYVQSEFRDAIRTIGRRTGKTDDDINDAITEMYTYTLQDLKSIADRNYEMGAVYSKYVGNSYESPMDINDRHSYESRERQDSTADLNKEIALTRVDVNTDKLTKKQMYSTVVKGKRTMHKTYQEAVDKAISNLDDTLVYSHTQYIDSNNIVHSARDECLGMTSKRYRDPKNMLGEERIWKKFNDDRVTVISANRKVRP